MNLLFQAEVILQFINFGIYLLYWYTFTSLNMIYLHSADQLLNEYKHRCMH